MTEAAKLIVGLAGAVGVALVAFAKRHGLDEQEPPGVPSGPGPSLTERFAVPRLAHDELTRWAGRVETDPAMRSTLEAYWLAAGEKPSSFPEGWQSSKPWSAAFISYVTSAAAPGALKPSPSHWGYMRSALGARPTASQPFPYRALPSTTVPRTGDIVVRTRLEGDRKKLDDVRDIAFHPSHGDIVVRAEPDLDHIDVVGGNLGHSVAKRRYPLRMTGEINDPRIIAVLRRTGEVPNV